MFTTILPSRNDATGGSGSSAPSTQASGLTFLGDRTLRLTIGGQRRIVVIRSGAAVTFTPSNNTTYAANASFGAGTNLGNNTYCVGNGTDNQYIITSLPANTLIGIAVFEYNGTAGSEQYNVNTATNNPITHTTLATVTYNKYAHTPFLTRREPYNLKTISRAFSQLYCIGAWKGTDYYHAWPVSEGDGDNLGGIDRSIHYKCSVNSDPTQASNWIPDSPVNADGDIPAFLDKATLTYTSANFVGLWSAGTYSQNQEVRYIGSSNDFIYRSNINGNTSTPPTNWTDTTLITPHCWLPFQGVMLAQPYGVGLCYTTDEWVTKTVLTDPIISITGTNNSFYVKVHPTKVGGYWYMFRQNPTTSLIQEDHLHALQILRTSSDPTTSGWTGWSVFASSDQLTGRGWGGGIDISQSWDEGGKYRAFISPHRTASPTAGGYNAKAEGETAFLTTNPVGDTIYEIEWSDWTSFQSDFYIVREVHVSDQLTEIELRTWSPKFTHGSDTFFIGTGFLWKGQTALNGIFEIEPMNDAKIVSTATVLTDAYQVGNTIYPDFCRFGMPHRSKLNDTLGSTNIYPYDVTGNSSGTIVGSPKVGRCNTIQPVSGGWVTFPNANWVLSSTKHSFKIIVGRNNNADNSYGICGIVGQFEYYRDSNSVFRWKIWAANGVDYKEYTLNYNTWFAQNDATQFLIMGHSWDNGTFRPHIDYALNPTVTVIRNDTFTTCATPSAVLQIGAVGTDFSNDVVGSFLKFDGADATDSNYLNNNLIGY